MEDKIREYFAEHGLENGHMLLFQGLYDVLFFTHKVIYNACLYDIEGRKIWYGDVDLTRKWKLFLEASCVSKRTLILSKDFYCSYGLCEVLRTLKRDYGELTTKSTRWFGAPIIIVRNAKSILNEHYGIWVFSYENKDEKVLKELSEFLEAKCDAR
jgi:hypothetical protein